MGAMIAASTRIAPRSRIRERVRLSHVRRVDIGSSKVVLRRPAPAVQECVGRHGPFLDAGIGKAGEKTAQPLRRRTRSFIGVGPRSNASRILRSRYRRYVGGSSCVAKRVNVGGSAAPWVA